MLFPLPNKVKIMGDRTVCVLTVAAFPGSSAASLAGSSSNGAACDKNDNSCKSNHPTERSKQGVDYRLY